MAKKNLAQLLKADLPAAAELVRSKGRGKDTMLAHITPREAEMLKQMGGRGSINPETGLPEYESWWDSFTSWFTPSYGSDVPITPTVQQPEMIQGPPSDTVIYQSQPSGGGSSQAEMDYDRNALARDYMYQVQAGKAEPGQSLYYGGPALSYFPGGETSMDVYRSAELAGVIPPYGYTGQSQLPYFAYAQPETVSPTVRSIVPTSADVEGGAAPTQQITSEDAGAIERVARGETTAEQENATAKAQGKPGILDKFGEDISKNPMKYLIAALGVGAMGLNYQRAQQQGSKYARQIADAYGQAAAQTRELAKPFMQQGGQALGQAVAGQLSAANQQQLEAARAQAAQQVARSGGVATAQAQRAIEDARQRLLQNQQTAAIQLLGAGTPLISTAIQQQLSGTTQGLGTQLQLSQQAGQAASNLVSQLALLYARS